MESDPALRRLEGDSGRTGKLDTPGRIMVFLFLVNSVIGLGLGVAGLLERRCASCTGLIAAALPWLGFVLYAILAVATPRCSTRYWFLSLVATCAFVHMSLTAESLILKRVCWGCASMAGITLAASCVQAWRQPTFRPSLTASVVLGGLCALFSPYERLEDSLTRNLWPSKVLEQAPGFVDVQELKTCEHSCPVRLIVYEDEATCYSCASFIHRILPLIQQDFTREVCVHTHRMSERPKDQVLPLSVFVSRRGRLFVLQGSPEYPQVRRIVEVLLEDAGIPAASVDR